MRRFVLRLLICLVFGMATRAEAAGEKPVWLLGNGFHTSVALRARDVPFWREISGSRDLDELAIGWGASADYRGPSNVWTLIQAIFPNRAAIHVVPIRGPITQRFSDSDVVLLWLTPEAFSKLISEIDQSFAFAPDHHRILLGRGYYPDSRFYASSELFYFPYVCNVWVAIKLSRAGTRFCVPGALLSQALIDQAARKGTLIQHRHGPRDGY